MNRWLFIIQAQVTFAFMFSHGFTETWRHISGEICHLVHKREQSSGWREREREIQMLWRGGRVFFHGLRRWWILGFLLSDWILHQCTIFCQIKNGLGYFTWQISVGAVFALLSGLKWKKKGKPCVSVHKLRFRWVLWLLACFTRRLSIKSE